MPGLGANRSFCHARIPIKTRTGFCLTYMYRQYKSTLNVGYQPTGVGGKWTMPGFRTVVFLFFGVESPCWPIHLNIHWLLVDCESLIFLFESGHNYKMRAKSNGYNPWIFLLKKTTTINEDLVVLDVPTCLSWPFLPFHCFSRNFPSPSTSSSSKPSESEGPLKN